MPAYPVLRRSQQPCPNDEISIFFLPYGTSKLIVHLSENIVRFLGKTWKTRQKKSKITGVILMENSIFFEKNIHLNLIKQRVKWTSVVTD